MGPRKDGFCCVHGRRVVKAQCFAPLHHDPSGKPAGCSNGDGCCEYVITSSGVRVHLNGWSGTHLGRDRVTVTEPDSKCKYRLQICHACVRANNSVQEHALQGPACTVYCDAPHNCLVCVFVLWWWSGGGSEALTAGAFDDCLSMLHGSARMVHMTVAGETFLNGLPWIVSP